MAAPIYVLGGYQTDFAKTWSREGQDISDMVRDATHGALAACDLEPSAIETIHVGNAFAELQRNLSQRRQLFHRRSFVSARAPQRQAFVM